MLPPKSPPCTVPWHLYRCMKVKTSALVAVAVVHNRVCELRGLQGQISVVALPLSKAFAQSGLR